MFVFVVVWGFCFTDTGSVDQKELDTFYEAFRKASSDGKVVTLSEFSKVFHLMNINDPVIVESTFNGMIGPNVPIVKF